MYMYMYMYVCMYVCIYIYIHIRFSEAHVVSGCLRAYATRALNDTQHLHGRLQIIGIRLQPRGIRLQLRGIRLQLRARALKKGTASA